MESTNPRKRSDLIKFINAMVDAAFVAAAACH
jgi:hypothetical protein